MRTLFLGLVAALAACSHDAGPGPGTTAPGDPCGMPADCGCWTCACEGVGGAPGGAQLCLNGRCPTGEEACEPVCALANAKVEHADSVDMCPGRL